MKEFSFRHFIHQKIMDHLKEVEEWFLHKQGKSYVPFYSSFDIRDSNLKVACVDANAFPAGFNNICEEDQKRASSLIKNYLDKISPGAKKIILLAEEHTRNFYYWDNVFVIKFLIEETGYDVTVCVPGKKMTASQEIITASGKKLFVYLLEESEGDLIISNNDFSVNYKLPDIPCHPPLTMGWFVRKKHRFFKEYNRLAEELASLLKIDPWHLTVETELFSPFDMESKKNFLNLKDRADLMIRKIKQKTPEGLTKEEPYLFLKNNSGTYGLGVMSINNVEGFHGFTYKARKKMKASKGEQVVSEIIIQEGIPTYLQNQENQSAEPVVYMIGSQLAGGFLRSHEKKDYKTNLNSPGAVFRRLCMSDLEIKIQGLVMENVYGWIAKLGSIALSREIEHTGVKGV